MEKLISPKNRQNVTILPDFYEKKAWKSAQIIAGMDEVGRGCLAGPVVAAAVILPPKARFNQLKDSKKLSASQRKIAHRWVLDNCIWGLGVAHHRLIDKYNIYQSTVLAMKRALSHLTAQICTTPDIVVVDAVSESFNDVLSKNSSVYSFIKGEDYSRSIAAASIIAKEIRDEIMRNYASVYPQYGFEKHSGYGTKQHITALDTHGVTPIHRMTFLKKYHEKKRADKQQTLF